jgi:hypothetical protein
MQPNDYSGAFSTLPSPADAMMSGFKNGMVIKDAREKEEAQKAAAAAEAQMNNEMFELSKNPTTEGIARMTVKYPKLSESYKRTYDMLDPAERQAKMTTASQVYAALEAKNPTIASDLLMRQAEGQRNAGNAKEAEASETQAKMIRENPEIAKIVAGKLLAVTMGPDKFAATFKAIGEEKRAEEQAPGVLKKTNADADSAVLDAKKKGVESKYTEQGILLDMEKKGWDIKKIKADIDISRESNRIAAMNAAASRTGNDLKRQELQLKINDAITARDDKVREKVAKAESGITAMDNMMNTVMRLKKNPALNDVIGSLEGSDWYPTGLAAAGTAPQPWASSSDERADAIALIETLKSQAFLSQVPTIQGMGSLSNAEGAKLEQGLQNLGRKQSERQFRDNLDEVLRIVSKGRENITKKYGAPRTAPDTPADGKKPAPAGQQKNIVVDF